MRSWIGCLALSVAVSASAPQAPAELTVSVHSPAIQPGAVVRLDVSCTCRASGRPAVARVFDREIPLVAVREGAWAGLIGIDLDTAPGTYPIQIAAESADARR